jgi:HPt (histidine-containing phosphotransfer) domain-containing protein
MHYLKAITSDNRELMIELIDIFLEEVPQAIEKIKVFYQDNDWTSIQRAAHKLRSNYKYVGAEEAEAFLKTLETDFGVEQNKQLYAPAIEALQQKTFQIIKTLTEEKQKL